MAGRTKRSRLLQLIITLCLNAGMGRSQAHHAFRFSDTDGRMLAIRPDVTALVARAAATVLPNVNDRSALCYVAPVFRRQPQSHAEWKRELMQIGARVDRRRRQRMADHRDPGHSLRGVGMAYSLIAHQ
mgnify:CR=1 FL=1